MRVSASATRATFAPYIPLLAYALFACLIALVGLQGFNRLERLIEVEKLNDLGAIADIKVGQIISWRDGHRRRAETFFNGSLLAAEFEQWLHAGDSADMQEQKLLRVLVGLQLTHGYAAVSLIDRQGVARISTGKVEKLDEIDAKLVLEAMNDRHTIFSDVRKNSQGDHPISFSLAAPLIDANEKKGRVVGTVLLQIDPYDFLYPLIQSWPSPSQTAETLLVRREGDEVVFLNDLRHLKSSALSLRLPLSTPNLPSAVAMRGGGNSTINGIDYRGVAVVAAMRSVPGTSWVMVAKVDEDEIFAPINQLKEWAAVIGLAFAVFGGFFFFVWLQGVQALQRRLKVEHDAALERELLLRHFEYLTKYASDIIIVIDETGRILEANQRTEEAFGYTQEELVNMRVHDIRPPSDDPAAFDWLIKELMEAGELRFEDGGRRKDGSVFPVEVNARVIDIQGKRYLHCIIRDTTERKQVEAELRESEARFRYMADNALALIWLSDIDNLGTWFSKGWLQYTGRTMEQELGFGWVDGVHPDDLPWCLSYCSEAFQERRKFEMEFRLRRADGSYGWIADTGMPRFTDSGEFEGYIGYCWDITEHKQYQEMRAAMEHAGRVNIAGEMATGIAHEISQPLAACANYLDGCLRRMGEQDWDREKLHKAIQLAYNQAERAGKIIKHLKSMVRKQGNERILIDINQLAQETIDFLEGEIRRQGITVNMSLLPLPPIMACRVEIEQVFLNLYLNAIQAMTSSPQRKLSVSTHAGESGAVMVEVIDTGKGIAAADMEALFNMFHSSKREGLGLGLAICRTIVENHGGRIWADSQDVSGTTFHFTLPVEGHA